jgi:dihydroorotate dehydrogenase (fumarate)
VSDLRTTYLGLSLANPVVASAGPVTGDFNGLLRLEQAGAAAVVLPSLFEEQITHDELDITRMFESSSESFVEATTFFPDLDEYNAGPQTYLEYLEAAKQALGIPVIASLNGASDGGWVRYGRLMQDAGADALELNVYYVGADPATSADDVERRYLDLVLAVRQAIDIPLAVKIGPYFSALANMARKLVDTGADGLVVFNRFLQPDIDLETLEVRPTVHLSSSEEIRLPLRWIAILRGLVNCSLACTSGVHTWEDAVKAILAGADVTMMTSALLRNGPEHVSTVVDGISAWLVERGYESVGQARGSVAREAIPDPAAYERANYMEALISYTSSFQM